MFDAKSLRGQFPALNRLVNGKSPIYLDGPGGTQVPQRVIDAMVHYLSHCNANHGGAFATSRESDEILHQAHAGMADFLNVPSADEIVFGANMTTLTLHLSRAISRTLRPGDEIMVTRLDHDANVTPWILAARDAGASVRTVDVHPEDCTLDLEDLRRQLSSRTRWLAMACASNAVGTINDVPTITRWAHDAGAKVFLDAVHYAPHGPIDIQSWYCDFLTCSTYKFFGPHVGVLWGKRQLLEELPAYKLRPVPEALPYRWMTGTQNHEGLAGVSATLDYLADIGSQNPLPVTPAFTGRRLHLRAAMTAIQAYESTLAQKLLAKLAERPRFKVWGITNLNSIFQRVPTISITIPGRNACQIAEHLASRNIFVWSGNMYAIALTERLKLEDQGGLLRIGLMHYNTPAEIDQLIQALDDLD
ncbi:MAG TPA: cysteine desulfurase-like protein [Gemmataceae bacterium]|nr:cysteine desulfurase-like protein [Gemmataceae bacterium]